MTREESDKHNDDLTDRGSSEKPILPRGADFKTPGEDEGVPHLGMTVAPAGGEEFGYIPVEDIVDTTVQNPSEEINKTISGDVAAADGMGLSDSTHLDQILHIRKHIIDGELSGIIPVVSDDDEFAKLLADQDRPEYEVQSELARGGMGVVYTATQTSLNRKLVLKTLRPGTGTTATGDSEQASSWQEDRKLRAMFVSEAVVTANLVHPNIVPVHDLGQTEDGKLFYSMKKVEGVPWHRRMTNMTVEQNLDVLMKVCDAVAFAHFNGVINRDLKPENVAIGSFGEVAVLDWGLAVTTPVFRQRDSVLIHGEGFGGSPGYMAPEQVRGKIEDITFTTDVYLLGAILYQIVAGRAPHNLSRFKGLDHVDAVKQALLAAMNNEIEPTEYTGELFDIAMKAMSTDRADRYRSVEDFQNAIREYRITGRADQLLRTVPNGNGQPGYENFQGALALYDEAAKTWPSSERARLGRREAKLRYATLAHQRGDFDLGLQVLGDETDPDFAAVRRKLERSRNQRKFIRATWSVATAAAVLGLAVAGYQWREAESAEKDAKDALTLLEEKSGTLKEVERDLKASEEAIGKAEEEVAKIEAEAKQRVAEAKQRVAESEEQAKQRVAEIEKKAEDAKRKALENALFAEFEAWQTQLSAASKTGDYATALSVVEQMLGADNRFVRESEEAFLELRDALRKNQSPLRGRADSAAISENGDVLAVAGVIHGGNETVAIWRIDQPADIGNEPNERIKPTEGTRSVFVSPNDRFVATQSDSGVAVWTADGRELSGPLPKTRHATVVRFSKSGNELIVGTKRGEVHVFEVDDESVERVGGQDLGDYRVADILWQAEDSGRGFLIVILSGTRQVLVGSIAFEVGNRGLSLPARKTDGTSHKWTQLELPAGARPRMSRLFVSGDSGYLAITNRDDGDLLLLPRRRASKPDQFPFMTPLEMQTQKRTWRWKNLHTGTVTHVAISANSKVLATAADDSTIRIWRLDARGITPAFANRYDDPDQPTSLSESNFLRGHADAITSLNFVRDNSDTLISTSADRTVRVWNLATYATDRANILRRSRKSRENKTNKVATAAAHRSPDSNAIQLTSFQQERKTDGIAMPIGGHLGSVSSVAFSRDSKLLVTAGQDQTVRVWDAATGAALEPDNVFSEGHNYNISQMLYFPDGRHLATSGYDGTLLIWDTDRDVNGMGREVARLSGLGMANAMTVSADGRMLVTSIVHPGATSRERYGAEVWDANKLIAGVADEPIAVLSGAHDARVTVLAVSPDGERVVSGDRRGKLTVWSSAGDLIGATKKVHEDGVSAMAFVSNERFVTASFDGTIKLWNIDVGGSVRRDATASFRLDEDYVWRLKVSPNGQRLLTTAFSRQGKDGPLTLALQVWNITKGESESRPFRRTLGSGTASAYQHDLAWSPDGSRAVLALNGQLRFFETSTWRRVLQLAERSDALRPASATFSPIENDSLATFDGRTVHLWRLTDENGQTVAAHTGTLRSSARVASAGFSSDSNFIITASRSLRVFKARDASAATVLRIERVDDGGGKPLHGGVLTWAEFTPEPDSYSFATSGLDGTARVWNWNPAGNAAPSSRVLNHVSPVRQVRWAPAGDRVLTVGDAGIAKLWDLTEETPKPNQLTLPRGSESVSFACGAFSQHGNTQWVAAGGYSEQQRVSRAFVWRLGEGRKPTLHSVVDARDYGTLGVTALAFSKDSSLLTGGGRGTLLKWSYASDRLDDQPIPARMLFPIVRMDSTRQPQAHRGSVNAVTVSRSGRIASAGADGALIWNLARTTP